MARQEMGPTTTSSLRTVVRNSADGWSFVELAGAIDENADVAAMFGQLSADTVMNMQRVERVNSMGVHRWIPLVAKFTREHRLVLDEISYPLVQNANVVANLFGSAVVRSCMAPYYCAQCKENFTLAVESQEVANAGGGAPAKQCGRCRSPLEFDELDGYFAFFAARRR